MEFRLLRVDLSAQKTREETVKEDLLKKWIGGRGLGAYLALKEIPKGVDPLSKDNIVYIMTGPLTGVTTMSGRYHVIGKSPKTGILGESNSGGKFGPWLRFSGYDGIAIHGASDEPVYISIIDGEVKFHSACHLWGKGVVYTDAKVREELGYKEEDKGSILSIGPAGENLSKISAIMNDKYRAAGRTGLAAVLGYKKLKAIFVYGTRKLEVSDREAFTSANSELAKKISEHPVSKTLNTYGTAALVNVINSLGGFPSRNWDDGIFENAYNISGERLAETYLIERIGCWGCIIKCSRVSRVPEGPFAVPPSEGPEYESIWALGSQTGTGDLDAVAKLNYLCNDLGFDTISTGNTLATAIDLYMRGKVPKEHTSGLELRWGNAPALVELLWRAAYRTDEFSSAVADGAPELAEKYGEPDLAVHVRKLEPPAYDPRSLKSMAIAYATANRGACHLRAYSVAAEALGIPRKMDPLSPDGEKVDLVIWMQNYFAFIDSGVVCKFVTFSTGPEDWVPVFNAVTGWGMSAEDLVEIGSRIYNVERLFAVREGIFYKDYIPKRLLEEPIKRGPGAGQTAKTSEPLLKEYWEKRGWDEGKPKRETLEKLGLQEFVEIVS